MSSRGKQRDNFKPAATFCKFLSTHLISMFQMTITRNNNYQMSATIGERNALINRTTWCNGVNVPKKENGTNGLERGCTGSYLEYEYRMFQLIYMCQITRLATCRYASPSQPDIIHNRRSGCWKWIPWKMAGLPQWLGISIKKNRKPTLMLSNKTECILRSWFGPLGFSHIKSSPW